MRSLFFKIFLWFWVANIVVGTTAVVAAFLLRKPDDAATYQWRSVAGQALGPQARAAIEVLERDGQNAVFDHLDHQDAEAGTHTFLLDETGRDLGGHRVPDEVSDVAERARSTGGLEVASNDTKTMVALTATGKDGNTYVFAREMLLNSERFRGPPPMQGFGRSGFDDGPRGGPGRGPPPDGPRRGPGGRGPPPNEDVGPGRDHGPPADDERGPGRGHGPPPKMNRSSPGPLAGVWTDPGTFAAILGAVVGTGGIVCYALARYLTRPVRLLRGAARRLADGDLTTRVASGVRRRRDEIGELAIDFDFMAERLESLVGAQKRLLRDISHELRSPLARLNVALELARRDGGPAATAALSRASREADRLNELIGQLLALARLEGGAVSAGQTLIDLRALVEDVVGDAEFEAAALDRHVRLVQCQPCEAFGSPDLLRSAVENVVRNAVHYTADGSNVDVSLRLQPNGTVPHAIVEIRDRGPGVPEEALQDIFQPFYRVSDARDRKSGGIGLGLAITDRAIRLHGGVVRAANAPDGGLVVQVELPCAARTDI